MGYTKDGQITNYWPDDDADTMYLEANSPVSFGKILEKACQKWGSHLSLDDLEIEAMNIHTHCIYYDCHDASDYTDFIVITYNPAPLV